MAGTQSSASNTQMSKLCRTSKVKRLFGVHSKQKMHTTVHGNTENVERGKIRRYGVERWNKTKMERRGEAVYQCDEISIFTQ